MIHNVKIDWGKFGSIVAISLFFLAVGGYFLFILGLIIYQAWTVLGPVTTIMILVIIAVFLLTCLFFSMNFEVGKRRHGDENLGKIKGE